MPGCKPKDMCVVIKAHHVALQKNVGTFHTVTQRCKCHTTWWELEAGQKCVGYIGKMNGNDIIHPIQKGQCHCAPDECLHPIRPPGKPDELPAPAVEAPKEITHA